MFPSRRCRQATPGPPARQTDGPRSWHVPWPPMRVAMIAAECEPWAKTGGLADVVDALARALPRVSPPAEVTGDRTSSRRSNHTVDAPVDVFLPRYRDIALPKSRSGEITVRLPDARTGGSIDVTVAPVTADGYRLRLVDYPPAFDRDGIYGLPDDAWRFTILARSALEALRSDAATGGWPATPSSAAARRCSRLITWRITAGYRATSSGRWGWHPATDWSSRTRQASTSSGTASNGPSS